MQVRNETNTRRMNMDIKKIEILQDKVQKARKEFESLSEELLKSVEATEDEIDRVSESLAEMYDDRIVSDETCGWSEELANMILTLREE